MRSLIPRALAALVLAATVVPPAFAQTPGTLAAAVRHLSVEEAVRLALEQNLGLRIERLNPQIEDISISQARSLWAPTLSASLNNNSQNQASTSVLSGGSTRITDSNFSNNIRLDQQLPTGATYSAAFISSRLTSTNLFNNYDPQLRSNFALNVNQPLLRNFKTDNVRQLLATSRKDREAADVQLQSSIVQTTRNVKNAYWDLAYQIDNLKAQQQSLDLARRLLADNEKRVQIGTMAPIDIVEAQSEVARNEESVIVAEAAIAQAQDRLRALILDPATPDFWNISLEPSDTALFLSQVVDVDAAVRHALEVRTDAALARNSLARNDISIRYLRNQSMPELNLQASYGASGVGGVQLAALPFTNLPAGPIERPVVSQRSFGSVLTDLFANAYPTWTVGVQIGYALGTSTGEANLARARLQHSQAETQLKNLELQIATQVRDAARQVQTNQKRVDSARAARELAERRLEAEEKKFAAGIQISFFVFQAQRDLAQARTNEIRAVSDYNKSQVDFEAVQQSSLTGNASITSAAAGAIPAGAIQR